MARAALVFDINGVLADVRKKSQPAVPSSWYRREDQFVMPNTQKVYLRPGALDMMASVMSVATTRYGAAVIAGVWTSRLRKNATPILQWLEQLMNARYPTCLLPFRFSFLLSGEDCIQTQSRGGFAANPYKPTLIKSVSVLRERLEPTGMLVSRARLLFLDDHPDQLVMDYDSWYVGCDTFDALRIDESMQQRRGGGTNGRGRSASTYSSSPTRRRNLGAEINYMDGRKEIILNWMRDCFDDDASIVHTSSSSPSPSSILSSPPAQRPTTNSGMMSSSMPTATCY